MIEESVFGWSYPAGCSGPPDEDYPEEWEITPRCDDCGSWMSRKPVRVEEFENAVLCDGKASKGLFGWIAECGYCDGKHDPHRDIFAAGTINVHWCKRCKKESNVKEW